MAPIDLSTEDFKTIKLKLNLQFTSSFEYGVHKVKAINEKLYTCFQMGACSRQNTRNPKKISIKTNEEEAIGAGGGGGGEKKPRNQIKEKLKREQWIKKHQKLLKN